VVPVASRSVISSVRFFSRFHLPFPSNSFDFPRFEFFSPVWPDVFLKCLNFFLFEYDDLFLALSSCPFFILPHRLPFRITRYFFPFPKPSFRTFSLNLFFRDFLGVIFFRILSFPSGSACDGDFPTYTKQLFSDKILSFSFSRPRPLFFLCDPFSPIPPFKFLTFPLVRILRTHL